MNEEQIGNLVGKIATLELDDCWQEIEKSILDCTGASKVYIFIYETKVSAFEDCSSNKFNKLGIIQHEDIDQLIIHFKNINNKIEVLKVHRAKYLIGFLVICEAQTETNHIARISDLIPFLYNRKLHHRIIFNLKEPVNFFSDGYYEDLKKVAKNATGMEFGALRLVEETHLITKFVWGNFKHLNKSNYGNWDLLINENPIFQKTLDTGELQICENLQHLEGSFRLRDEQKKIHCFCSIPVKVGKGILGIMTVALKEEYTFEHADLVGFLAVSNSVGVSISNYINFQKAKQVSADIERITSSIIGVEVATSIRHEVIGVAGNITNSVNELSDVIGKEIQLSSEGKENINFYIDSIKKNASDIEDSILRMKQVLQVQKVAKKISLSTIWAEAKDHLSWRISENHVNVSEKFEKRNENEMYYIPDVVRHVFQNLLLNSLDSFDKSAKSNRKINLTVYSPNLKKNTITFSYSDSGKGLDKDKLNRLLINFNKNKTKKVEIEELIFREQITTKENGSGWGLYLCRKMTKYHGGGIHYVEPKGRTGIRFIVVLSNDLDKLAEQSGGEIICENKDGKRETYSLKT